MDTNLEQYLKANIVQGSLQFMGQVRRWLDDNDHLGNEQSWDWSCEA